MTLKRNKQTKPLPFLKFNLKTEKSTHYVMQFSVLNLIHFCSCRIITWTLNLLTKGFHGSQSQLRQASNLASCLSLPRAGLSGTSPHAQLEDMLPVRWPLGKLIMYCFIVVSVLLTIYLLSIIRRGVSDHHHTPGYFPLGV